MGMESGQDCRFKAWMGQHLGVLQRISRAFATGADQADLMQELMLAVWRAAPAFRGESKDSTFIFRVAHNRALTWRRSETLRIRRAEDAQRGGLEVTAGDNAHAALLERLYAAIRTLDPVDRSLVVLSLEGMSYAEIGAVHGLTETNVGARLTRARKKLTQRMEKYDD
jgi:RNA polymerase sigma factor (sigma-70 family)